MELSPPAQRVLGCLVEKALTTPDQYPLTGNALRLACNQATGREPVVDYDDEDVHRALEELRPHRLVRTEHLKGSRSLRWAHRVPEVLDLDVPEQAVVALLLLRGPQTPGELRSRSGRLHGFASVEDVEAVLTTLADRPAGALVERLEREPGRRESRWAHRLGAAADAAAGAAGGPPSDGGERQRWRPFADAVGAGDVEAAVGLLADEVELRGPVADAPTRGAAAAAPALRALGRALASPALTDVLGEEDRAVLRFTARVADQPVEGVHLVRVDDAGRIAELTVLVRPLSALTALAARTTTDVDR